MGIITSTLFGLGVGAVTWRYMRFKNGDSVFTLVDTYDDFRIPKTINHDGSKAKLPWQERPYGEILAEIELCALEHRTFEGCDITKFNTAELAYEDSVTYGQVIHEAHLHTQRGKRCRVYLRGDHFILNVSNN